MTAHKAVKSLKPELDSFCFLSHNFINLLGFFSIVAKPRKERTTLSGQSTSWLWLFCQHKEAKTRAPRYVCVCLFVRAETDTLL